MQAKCKDKVEGFYSCSACQAESLFKSSTGKALSGYIEMMALGAWDLNDILVRIWFRYILGRTAN